MAFREDLEALILSCLSVGPAHGYEISKRIRLLSESALSVAEGKLYPALHALEESGGVAGEWVTQGTKPPRKVYDLTPKGKLMLEQKRTEWQAFSKSIDTFLNLEPKTSTGVI